MAGSCSVGNLTGAQLLAHQNFSRAPGRALTVDDGTNDLVDASIARLGAGEALRDGGRDDTGLEGAVEGRAEGRAGGAQAGGDAAVYGSAGRPMARSAACL